MDYFIYNGIDSRDFGLYLINDGGRQSSLLPPKKTHTVDIAGTNGKTITEQTFQPRDIPLKFRLTDNSISNKRKIVQWFSKLEEAELILSYEVHKVYIGTFKDKVNIMNYLNGGTFTLNFKIYNPIAKSRLKTISNPSILYNSSNYYGTGLIYGLSEDQYSASSITTQTDITLYNGSTVDGSLPIINISGSADDIVVTHYSDSARTNVINSVEYGSFSGDLVIDCELEECFLNSSLNNKTHNGKFLSLNGRTNTVPLGRGDVVEINSGNVTIEDDPLVDINDYLNQVLILRYDDNVVYREITSVDDVNNILYFGDIEVLDNDSNRWAYSVYDMATGNNYLRIDGTNLNITTINFDFNFLYL